MSITKNAMVLNLQIGVWQGYRLDKEATNKVTSDANADADAARVNKHLVPREALKAVVAASNAIRTHFYSKTLPWKDNGDRLLTRLAFTDFIVEHGDLKRKFYEAVDEFLEVKYPAARDQAEFRMGDLFKPDDYPVTDRLRGKFYVNLDIDAVTEAGDFRVEMDETELSTIRNNIETALGERLNKAVADVWERLAGVVTHFADKMRDPKAIFRDSTITNIEELVDLLPQLNVTGDANLDHMAKEVKRRLAGLDPKDLRKDTEARAAAVTEADEIMEKMRGYMSAFGGAA